MDNKLIKNKTVNVILAVILSLFMPGLGQVASGRIKRGILLYVFAQILFVSAAVVCILPFPHLNIIAAATIFLSVYLFVIVDSILIAKNPENTLKLKPMIGVSLLIGLSIINSSVVEPTIKKTIRDNYIQAFKIPSGSMTPTLVIGDHILVNKLQGNNSHYKRGDIIVFDSPEDASRTFIRRIVGSPGDVIEIKDKQLFINGKTYREDYIASGDSQSLPLNAQQRDNFGPIQVPKDSLFVLGDNRSNSYDSRHFGFIDMKKIKGKAATIYWSWDKEEESVRWNRVGKIIH